MITISITSNKVQELKGIGKASGKPYEMSIQKAYAHLIDGETGEVSEFPEPFEFVLPKGQEAYKPGKYTLNPSAIFVGRDGRLSINPLLVPKATFETPSKVGK